MEYKEVVIKIPVKDYDNVCRGELIDTICDAIANGIVLPKGHGRLIDEKEVYKKFYCRCLAEVAKEVLKETQTIIEAESEVKDEVYKNKK